MKLEQQEKKLRNIKQKQRSSLSRKFELNNKSVIFAQNVDHILCAMNYAFQKINETNSFSRELH